MSPIGKVINYEHAIDMEFQSGLPTPIDAIVVDDEYLSGVAAGRNQFYGSLGVGPQPGTIFPAVPRHRGTQGQALHLMPATGNQLFILFIDVPTQKGDGTVSLQKGVGKRETPAQMAAAGP